MHVGSTALDAAVIPRFRVSVSNFSVDMHLRR